MHSRERACAVVSCCRNAKQAVRVAWGQRVDGPTRHRRWFAGSTEAAALVSTASMRKLFGGTREPSSEHVLRRSRLPKYAQTIMLADAVEIIDAVHVVVVNLRASGCRLV